MLVHLCVLAASDTSVQQIGRLDRGATKLDAIVLASVT